MAIKKKEKFSVSKRFKSFPYAFKGIRLSFVYEHNMRIHLFAAILVAVAGFYFRLAREEWIEIVFAIGFVFCSELFNSVIEALADFVSPGIHPEIGKIKDISAGAVLIAVITAVITGLLVFVPHILDAVKHFQNSNG
jgi:diacylglycerol kinase (ATP)